MPVVRFPLPELYRQQESTVETVMPCFHAMVECGGATGKRINRVKSREMNLNEKLLSCKALSVKWYPNPWRMAYFGENKGGGYMRSAWVGLMHTLELGLMKKACGCTVSLIKETAKERRIAMDLFISKLDARAQSIMFTRQGDRASKIPLKNFRKAISSLPKIKSQEYPACVLAMKVCLGVSSETFLDFDKLREVQDCLSDLYTTWYILKRESIPRDKIGLVGAHLKR